MRHFICIILFAIVLPSFLVAQQRFNAGLVIGVNASQINGDDSAGFNKLGLQGGIRGITIFNERSELSIEILFSQRGSQTELTPGNFQEQRKIHLNYVAVPVAYNYKDWPVDDFYRLHFHAGLSYGRLISSKIQNESVDLIANEFNNNDLSWIAGTAYYFNKNLGVGLRYNRSITLLFNNAKTIINSNSLLSHFLSFQGLYIF